MTKAELITILTTKFPDLPDTDIQLSVNTIFETMAHELEKGGRIEIRGFGSFSVRQMKARQGRNPKTGEAVQISPRSSVHFKPGLELRNRVKCSLEKYPSLFNAH